jgi:hypothetical protein
MVSVGLALALRLLHDQASLLHCDGIPRIHSSVVVGLRPVQRCGKAATIARPGVISSQELRQVRASALIHQYCATHALQPCTRCGCGRRAGVVRRVLDNSVGESVLYPGSARTTIARVGGWTGWGWGQRAPCAWCAARARGAQVRLRESGVQARRGRPVLRCSKRSFSSSPKVHPNPAVRAGARTPDFVCSPIYTLGQRRPPHRHATQGARGWGPRARTEGAWGFDFGSVAFPTAVKVTEAVTLAECALPLPLGLRFPEKVI